MPGCIQSQLPDVFCGMQFLSLVQYLASLDVTCSWMGGLV